MKNIKKVSAAAMSVMLMGYLAVPVFAEAEPSEKEEVIYIMTDAFGNVTDMEAVNIFSDGDITDYGDYSAVKILNTTDRITYDGSDADVVSFVSEKTPMWISCSSLSKQLQLKKRRSQQVSQQKKLHLHSGKNCFVCSVCIDTLR